MAKDYSLSFKDWKEVVHASFAAFPYVFWRIVAVNIFVILMMILGGMIFGGIGLVVLGGVTEIESLIANMTMGGNIGSTIIIAATLAFLLINWVLVFSITGKIGNLVVMKDYVNKKPKNPFRTYFVDTWHYFWRYVWIGLRVFWYVLWPVLIIGGAGFLLSLVAGGFTLTIASVLAAGVGIWRVVRVVFAQQMIVHFDKDSTKTFPSAIKMVNGNWWGVLLSIILFVIPVMLTRIIFWIPMILMSYDVMRPDENIVDIFSTLDFLYTFCVLAPLIIAFVYFLMLHLSKVKKVKP